jgi:hypothetical protein
VVDLSVAGFVAPSVCFSACSTGRSRAGCSAPGTTSCSSSFCFLGETLRASKWPTRLSSCSSSACVGVVGDGSAASLWLWFCVFSSDTGCGCSSCCVCCGVGISGWSCPILVCDGPAGVVRAGEPGTMFSLFDVLLMCANSFLTMFLAGVRCGVMLSSGSSVVGEPMAFWAEASW